MRRRGPPRETHLHRAAGPQYDCLRCGWSEIEDEGPALWTIMSEASDDDEPEQEAGGPPLGYWTLG